MQTERFIARNVKCNGCVATIRRNLLALSGVEGVEVTLVPVVTLQSVSGATMNNKASGEVTPQGSIVEVRGTGLSRNALAIRLTELGYPVVE
ncbi:Heavy metal transporter [Gammaproteobacteria bacterium]